MANHKLSSLIFTLFVNNLLFLSQFRTKQKENGAKIIHCDCDKNLVHSFGSISLIVVASHLVRDFRSKNRNTKAKTVFGKSFLIDGPLCSADSLWFAAINIF